MSTGLTREQQLEKQMEKQMSGCMAGLLQIFDRHQTFSGKRFYSAKRIPPSPVVDSSSESEKSLPASPAPARHRELMKPKKQHPVVASSPERVKKSPVAELRSQQAAATAVADLTAKSQLLRPILELKEGSKSSWTFCKESPRLSLDSRAITDANGGLHPKEIRTGSSSLSSTNRRDSSASDTNDESQQHSSPGVIARLMGLEPLTRSTSSETEKKPELRRSVSESRVSRDLFYPRFVAEGSSFYSNAVKDKPPLLGHCGRDSRDYFVKGVEPNRDCLNSPSPWRAPHHRKSFFDFGDFFPDPKQTLSSYREVENRSTVKGIDEPAKDLETLKQILEALQLKGLLHSRKLPEQSKFTHRNFVYELSSPASGGKSSRLVNSTPINRRIAKHYSPSTGANQSRGVHRNYSTTGENSPAVSPRLERSMRGPTRSDRNASPTRSNRVDDYAIGRRSNSPVKPKTLIFETPRRNNESFDNRRISPVHSPKLNPRRPGLDPTVSDALPRSKKPTADIHHKERNTAVSLTLEDESSSISGSSISTSTDTDRSSRIDEYKYCKEGRTLLERCDKLLYSIAEITAADPQPSPVSVLDPSFYKDESLSPSPVTNRRNIDFKADHSGELEDELWSSGGSTFRETPDDCDFVYISDVMRASPHLPVDPDVFLALEKQLYLRGDDTSKVSRLRRMLIFDTINELIGRKGCVPPWKSISLNISNPSVDDVWSEFQRIREHETGKDLFECICNVMKRDLCDDSTAGWAGFPLEMSEAILDIERMVFKDLVSEIIWDFATSSASRSHVSMPMPRRKLVF